MLIFFSRAANDFFMNPPSPDPSEANAKSKWDEKSCKALFDKYREKEGEDDSVVCKNKKQKIFLVLLSLPICSVMEYILD